MLVRPSVVLSILALTLVGCYAGSAIAQSQPPPAPGGPEEPVPTVLAAARIDLPCDAPGLTARFVTLGRGGAYVVDGCGMRTVYAASMRVTEGGTRPQVDLVSRLPIPPSAGGVSMSK